MQESEYALTVERCLVGMHNDIPEKPRISEGLGSLPTKVAPSQSQPFAKGPKGQVL